MNKNIFRKVSVLLVTVTLLVTLTGCFNFLSKKEKAAVQAFSVVLEKFPAVSYDGWYHLTAPDGDAKFIFSNDCVWLAIDATPFIEAGLDTSTLKEVYETVFYEQDLGFSLPGWDMLNQNVKDTALAQFEADIRYCHIVETDTTYKINFTDNQNNPNVTAFEWVKSPDSDLRAFIFTLKAEPLISAGVNPDKLVAWDYVESADGSKSFQKVIYWSQALQE